MDETKKALKKYVDAASDLAESVKDNIVHGGVITNDTVLALNELIIAANEIIDLNEILILDENETDEKLN